MVLLQFKTEFHIYGYVCLIYYVKKFKCEKNKISKLVNLLNKSLKDHEEKE